MGDSQNIYVSQDTPSAMKEIIANVAYSCASELGEGALWDERHSKLWWVDITRGHVHLFDPKTKINKTFQLESPVGTVVQEDGGGVIVAVRNGFARYDTESGVFEMIAMVEHENSSIRFNDGKCDPSGRFWAGTLAEDGTGNVGKLFTLGNDLSVTCKISGVGISNGLGWSPSGDTMYYIDSMSQKVVAYAYDGAHGDITDPKVVAEIDSVEGTPDGMCVDEEGMLWVALWGGAKVLRIHPGTGERLCEVIVPNVQKVTSCTLGGENLTTLLITTASQGLTPHEKKEQPNAGSLFSAEVGVRGLPANLFKGKLSA